MNNTSRITQMFKDKIKTLDSRGKNQILLDPGHCGVEVNERATLEAKLSIKEGRDSHLLLPVADFKAHWKKKGKEEHHNSCENTKRDRGILL
jgi:hypothetical protein